MGDNQRKKKTKHRFKMLYKSPMLIAATSVLLIQGTTSSRGRSRERTTGCSERARTTSCSRSVSPQDKPQLRRLNGTHTLPGSRTPSPTRSNDEERSACGTSENGDGDGTYFNRDSRWNWNKDDNDNYELSDDSLNIVRPAAPALRCDTTRTLSLSRSTDGDRSRGTSSTRSADGGRSPGTSPARSTRGRRSAGTSRSEVSTGMM